MKKFQKTVEDFVCEKCGTPVHGTGYTNHCPMCLWSKHVDKNPGDRLEACGGIMEPMRIEGTTPNYTIMHRCVSCNVGRRNKIQQEDMNDAIITLAAKAAT